MNRPISIRMSVKIRSKVGSKGELFPPIKIRRELGLEPGQQVYYYIESGRLIVEPIPDLRKILQTQVPKIEVSLEELREDRKRVGRDAET
ncbi:MAG: AbrB/MazE/SpoVT family DNA-binding domain-containing protein [Candidatus Hodarchaeota archaeon]